jgi:hypothetical protein
MNTGGEQGEPTPEEWSIKELWEKYEEIAMHFNDLLIRLRTQALGGVAALSAIVGIFGKSGTAALIGGVYVTWREYRSSYPAAIILGG